MTRISAVLTVLFALPLVLFGFGCLWSRLLKCPVKPALLPAIGLAVIVLIGGWLNLFRLVSVWTIGGCIVVGLLAAALKLRKSVEVSIHSIQGWPTWILIGAVIFFVILTQFPPAVFNYGDDFNKYFAHPVRMLQTGTLYGSALSAVGSETLGGQAFIQAFIVAVLPIEYINGADAVLGLLLCLVLARGLCAGNSLITGTTSFLCVAAVFIIEPQYVNVSSLYLSAALVMAATEVGRKCEPELSLLSVMYAALIALKTTMALFVVLHGIMLMIVFVMRTPKTAALQSAKLIGGSFLCLLPWLLLHAPSYLSSAPARQPEVGTDILNVNLLSFSPLPFGGSMALYSILVLSLIFLVAATAFRREHGLKADWPLVASVVVLAGGYLIFIYGVGPFTGYQYAARFYAPVMIGMTPVLIAAAIATNHFRRMPTVLLFSPVVIALAAFSPSRIQRCYNAARYGSALPFPFITKTTYIGYNRYVLDGVAEHEIRLAQEAVPAGTAILASVKYPFHLDFRRNAITDMDAAGLANPWAKIPEVNYVLLEGNSYGSRTEADLFAFSRTMPGARERVVLVRSLAMLHYLSAVVASGELIYQRGTLSVYRVHDLKPTF